MLRVCTARLSGACEQVASIYCAAAERPASVVRARLPLCPTLSPLVDTLLWFTVLSFIGGTGIRKKQSPEGCTEPSLTKAIVKCYWKSCLVLGIFTFLEVKIFGMLCVGFECMQISTEMDVMVGREDEAVCHRINLIMM